MRVELREQPELGMRIKELRLAAGLEQLAVAEALGLGQSSVSKIESGDRAVSGAELFRLADALSVSVDDILVVEQPRLEVAFRMDAASSAGAQAAVALVERLAGELDHLRALLP